MIKRRDFIVKTALGAATIPLSGLLNCRNGESGIKPAGGKVIDAHIHVVPGKIGKALDVMDDNKIRYALLIASIIDSGKEEYVGDRAFYELTEAIKPFKTLYPRQSQLDQFRNNYHSLSVTV